MEQVGGARTSAAAATLRRALGRSSASMARGVRGAPRRNTSTPRGVAGVARGGVRAKARPARLVRMGGAMYCVAAGRSLQRQPSTPRRQVRALAALRSAAKVRCPFKHVLVLECRVLLTRYGALGAMLLSSFR